LGVTNHIEKDPDKAKASEIWQRFLKFIFGFIRVFAIWLWPAETPRRCRLRRAKPTSAVTFVSIGVLSDFRKLWQQGFGKLAAVYSSACSAS